MRGCTAALVEVGDALGIQGVPSRCFSLDGEHAGILGGPQPHRQRLLDVLN